MREFYTTTSYRYVEHGFEISASVSVIVFFIINGRSVSVISGIISIISIISIQPKYQHWTIFQTSNIVCSIYPTIKAHKSKLNDSHVSITAISRF